LSFCLNCRQTRQCPPYLSSRSASKLNPFKWFQEHATTPSQVRVKNDLQRGNLWEFHQISRTNGRPFEPIVSLEKPKPFPKLLLQGTTLNGDPVDLFSLFAKSPGTLILVEQKRILSEFMSTSWRLPFKERYPDAPIFQLILSRDRLYSLFNWEVNRRMRKAIPKEEHDHVLYVEAPNKIDLNPDAIGINIENSYLTYAFLVDRQVQIFSKILSQF